jgi:pimeloyl-ACP methyl ester carboxylesterase
MSLLTAQTLEVPGAHLHYSVRGSGPVLLLIPGGAMDGGVFAGMLQLLTGDYTVVTYDPAGVSPAARSTVSRGRGGRGPQTQCRRSRPTPRLTPRRRECQGYSPCLPLGRMWTAGAGC